MIIPQFAFTTYPSQIFWLVVLFLLLFLLLRNFVVYPISKRIAARRCFFSEGNKQIAVMKKKVESLSSIYQRSLTKMEEDCFLFKKSFLYNYKMISEKDLEQFIEEREKHNIHLLSVYNRKLNTIRKNFSGLYKKVVISFLKRL